MKKQRRLLFSVTAADCDMQTFNASGPGGQHRDKKQTAVRFIHKASGAVGESREHRSQYANKKAAWTRMGESKKFKKINPEVIVKYEPISEIGIAQV